MTNELLTITATLIPDKGIGVHIQNGELRADLLAEALRTVIASCSERLDMLAHDLGGAKDDPPASTTH